MTIEIELDPVHHLDYGDCLEICGIILSENLEVVFSLDGKPKFKFSIHQKYGWDVYTWGNTKCDIDSGSNCSYLEFFTNNQFTLCFQVKFNQILTILNDNLISTSEILTPIQEVNSVKVSDENFIKFISFSDFSKRTSRFLQPTIHKFLETNKNNENYSVTIIESRRRIIFKSQNLDNDISAFSDSDNESDENDFEAKDFDPNFSYLNKSLLKTVQFKKEEYYNNYPNDLPANKYVINYFDPNENIFDSEIPLTTSFKNKIESQYFDNEKNKEMEENQLFDELKSHLENIKKTLKHTGSQIERYNSVPSFSLMDNDFRSTKKVKASQNFQIPVVKKDGVLTKLKVTNHNRKIYKDTKIPVLLLNPVIKEEEIVENTTISPITDQSKKRRQIAINRKTQIKRT